MRWNDATAQTSDNRYRYNGKENQDFVNVPYLDYGARMYDPRFSVRWNGPDLLAEKYCPISPYAFCANNPLKYVDPDGRKIDLSGMTTITLITLISDLQHITGLQLYYSDGEIVCDYDDVGNLISMSDYYSSTARDMLVNAINHEDTIYAFSSFDKSFASNDNQGWMTIMSIGIDSKQVRDFIRGTSTDLASSTMGYGMTFLHELGHTVIGGNRRDYYNAEKEKWHFGVTGPNVDFMNQIRRELGPRYGERLSYGYLENNTFLPFSLKSFNEIVNGQKPTEAYIKIYPKPGAR